MEVGEGDLAVDDESSVKVKGFLVKKADEDRAAAEEESFLPAIRSIFESCDLGFRSNWIWVF